MSMCGCDEPKTDAIFEHDHEPWWKSPELLLPVFSGIALVAGFIAEWTGFEAVGLGFFWLGLLLGGYTFAPGALTRLVTERKLGIGLLMTISAIGAIILGFVEEAAALAFLYSIVEALEDRAMGRARSGLSALLQLVPETVTVEADGATRTVGVAELMIGDRMIIKPGERVATDGIVRSGSSNINTSAITGESIPQHVAAGAEVPAGSINGSGGLIIEAAASGQNNSLTAVVSFIHEAQQKKGDRARMADRAARPLVPGVIILAAAVAIIGSLLGDPELWITRALVVLVAASPCALAISVPLTVVAGVGAASSMGVVIKSGAAFEELGRIKHVAFDKTGTLTRNEPTVVRVITAPGVTEAEALSLAAGLEQHSTHPLAQAITDAAETVPTSSDIIETPGAGITGSIGGQVIEAGSPSWLDPGILTDPVVDLQDDGMSIVVLRRDREVIGAIGIRDELRPEARSAITALTEQGMRTTMLSGDNAETARALAHHAGIDDVHAGLRPAEKAEAIRGLSRERPTAMIGDGINDAPALASADIGLAMGAMGSDAAIESADAAFLGSDLRMLPAVFEHARRGRRIITQNLVLSLLIIICLLPLAISGLLGLAAVVLIHEAGEIVVILNGLRARRMPVAAKNLIRARDSESRLPSDQSISR